MIVPSSHLTRSLRAWILTVGLLALALLGAAPARAQGNAALTATELELVMDATNLAHVLLERDGTSKTARALLVFATTLDPTCAPAKHLIDVVKDGGPVGSPVAKPTEEMVVRKLLAAASLERDENLSLLYQLMALQIDRENPEAIAAVLAAKERGLETTLAAQFEANRRLVLTEDLDYVGLLRPLYDRITDSRLENGAENMAQELADADRRLRERDKAAEADADIAKVGRRLLVSLMGLIQDRKDSLERLARAKTYEPSKTIANRAKYEQELREGRQRQMDNAYRDWEGKLKQNGRVATALFNEIRAAEEKLDTHFAERLAAARNRPVPVPVSDPIPPVADNNPPVNPPQDPIHDTGEPENEDWYNNRQNPDDWKMETRDDWKGPRIDPTKMVTPAHLINQVKEIGNWLDVQNRRQGKLVDGVYAQDPGDGRVILYVSVTSLFTAQDQETRFTLTKSMQAYWANRLESGEKVRGRDAAFIYVLNADKDVIGGSSEDRGGKVWVKERL